MVGRLSPFGCALALALATTGCDSLLGISEPMQRADGVGGQAAVLGKDNEPNIASNGGGASNAAAGDGGSAGSDFPPTVADAGAGAGAGGNTPIGCTEGERRCLDDAPQLCHAGQFASDPMQPATCDIGCRLGYCVDCLQGQAQCVQAGTASDPMGGALLCEDGSWSAPEWCNAYCGSSGCVAPTSCNGIASCAQGISCCRANRVEGGTFKRTYDGAQYTDENHPATLRSFVMDKFEVTVSRFRAFVHAYPGSVPAVGEGKSKYLLGDPGWTGEYALPATKAELEALLESCGTEEDGASLTTWTATPGPYENYAANCVSFPLAQAFCIADGGRLPTEAEWNYAAAGGDQQRVYPWSNPPANTTIRPENAHYFDQLTGDPTPSRPFEVGTKPAGVGRWGQEDLAGNVWEWTQDLYLDEYPPGPCQDCATLQDSFATDRVIRGGGHEFYPEDLFSAGRVPLAPTEISHFVGFRCVYELTSNGELNGAHQ